MNPVQEAGGVCFHCSWEGAVSLVAVLNQLPASQAIFSVPVLPTPAWVTVC